MATAILYNITLNEISPTSELEEVIEQVINEENENE